MGTDYGEERTSRKELRSPLGRVEWQSFDKREASSWSEDISTLGPGGPREGVVPDRRRLQAGPPRSTTRRREGPSVGVPPERLAEKVSLLVPRGPDLPSGPTPIVDFRH